MIRVFIGFDSREAVAFSVLAYSIQAQSTMPVAITPLMLPQLDSLLTRDRHPLQSTEFSFSRFLVPYLSGYEGWSLFMDCDMLVRDDIARLWRMRDERFAVQVVKHDHRPREEKKFLSQPQSAYAKKNWSSVMLFNNSSCRKLTPDYVNCASGLELHQFKWLDAESDVGALPQCWNHLVGYDAPDPKAAIAHFTVGGPYFPEYAGCEFGDEWHAVRKRMLSVGVHR